jgi:hypothetical protein
MKTRLSQAYRWLEDRLLASLALAWFGMLGDPDFPASMPPEAQPSETAVRARRA